MKVNFVMLKRGEILNDLLSEHPNAFLLLTLIAVRARRTPNLIKNLDICECQLGDYKSCGLTEQKYRTAKTLLEKLNLATFTPTNKGTIAKLINTDIYDINTEDSNGLSNNRITNKQRTDNEQITTNNNVNKEKNVKKVFQKPTVQEIKNYCLERKNNIDPESFFHFYESKDWKIGKNKMKNWKSAMITWEKKNKPVQEEKPMYATLNR